MEKSDKKRTKRIIQLLLLSGTAISLFFVPWILVWAWISPLPNTMQEQAEKAVDYGFSGVIVYVDQHGKSPAFYSAGVHNKANKLPAKKDAYFKIGSIAKLYDAVAVTKLVSQGRLDLNKTLAEYLPELENKIEYANEITLKMLVQHRSGIPNFTDTPDYWTHPKATQKENLQLILNKPANFEPDQEYEYCNTNYLLLNKIMDKTLGYENFKFIHEQILTPLNLNNTFASIKDVHIEDIMSGYHEGHQADLKTDDIGMIATAKDVGIFLRALNNGKLLTKKEQKIYSSIYEYEHSGWVPGYQSFAQYYKETDAVIVSFYSTTDPELLLWNLAEIINGRFGEIVKRKNT